MNRILDIIAAGILIVSIMPILFIVSIVLLCTGERQIFFMQDRIGRGGKIFKLFKFATMLKNSPHIGTGTVTLQNDPRVLPVGRFLRDTKINELPQLLNVLSGDMAIIGPRPQTRRCFDAFPPGAQRAIVAVRPGLSGIGSIIFRDEERLMAGAASTTFYDEVIMPYKGEVEQWYVRRRGLVTDLLLMLLTALVVVIPKSRLTMRIFPDLPEPPPELKPLLSL